MDNSILVASKSSQGIAKYFKGKNAYFAVLAAATIIGGPFAYGYIVDSGAGNNEKETKIIEVAPKKTDLQISISADGRLVSDKNINILFALTGTIKDVFVKDGQLVKKGDKIASLETKEFELALASAKTSKSIAVANLLSRQAGPSQFDVELVKKNISLAEKRLADVKKQNIIDIKNAELSVNTAMLNLQSSKAESTGVSSVSGYDIASLDLKIKQGYDDAVIKSGIAHTEVENCIKEASNILSAQDNDLTDTLGVLNSSAKNEAIISLESTKSLRDAYVAGYQDIKTGADYGKIEDKLNKMISLAEASSQLMRKTSLVLEASITSTKLTQSELDYYKNTISSESGKIKTQVEALNNSKQAIDSLLIEKKLKETSGSNLTTGNESKINLANQQLESTKLMLENAKAKASVNERESVNQLEVAKIQLSLKTETVRDVDIASLRAQITQAQNQIDEAQYRLEQAVVFAPIDGTVSNIAVKNGDVLSDKNKAIAIVINKNNFSVEAYIEEIDIAKIKNGQKVYLTFDALEGVKLEGAVNFISDVPKIEANGLVTYLVRIIVDNKKSAGIKDGMTAYAEFILAEAQNVIVLPVAAIKNVGGKSSVKLINNETKVVETGFTDGKSVEIISGLTTADKVLYADQ